MIRFRTKLIEMNQEELLNFIWLYNEYIKLSESFEDAYPVTIDVFYNTNYQQMIRKEVE